MQSQTNQEDLKIKYKTPQGLILGLNQVFSKISKENPLKTFSALEISMIMGEKVRELNLLAKKGDQELEEWDKKLPIFDKKVIEEEKTRILESLDHGIRCPYCSQYMKRYKRKLNSGMAYILIKVYKMIPDLNYPGGYFHINDIVKKTGMNPNTSEFQKLRFWGFTEPKSMNKDDKKTRGFYKLTEKGKNFVENRIEVPRHIFLYNGEFLGFSDEKTNIKKALNSKFDYEELMRS